MWRYDDCWEGDTGIYEEVELDLIEDQLVAEHSYYWQNFWTAKKFGFIDGEINISMERGILHDWLEKERYWYER